MVSNFFLPNFFLFWTDPKSSIEELISNLMSMFPDDWLPSQLTFEPERLVIVHVNNKNISQAVVVVVFSRSSKPHISSKPKSHHLVFSLVVYRTFFGGGEGEVREGAWEGGRRWLDWLLDYKFLSLMTGWGPGPGTKEFYPLIDY